MIVLCILEFVIHNNVVELFVSSPSTITYYLVEDVCLLAL